MLIKQDDLTYSIADALQFISCYHPIDFIQAMHAAYLNETAEAARDAIAQILINSRMCAEGRRPICQDTGIVTVFLKIGIGVQWAGSGSITGAINEGVRRAYQDPENRLRASIVADPAGTRKNTGDNTPAVIYTEIVAGNRVEVIIAAKGGGSEAKARLGMLNPADSIIDWVLDTVPGMGAGWCPPGILGIGIGGTADKAMMLAREALMEPINLHRLRVQPSRNTIEDLRLTLADEINALGIGAQGLGGLTTVLDVKIKDYPTHAANKPVALIPNCAATRHTHFTLDGSGPVMQRPPSLDDWPRIDRDSDPAACRVNLDTISKEEIGAWRPGQTLLLSGKILTGRDAAHRRIEGLLDQGLPLPDGVDFKDRFIYYVGPVDPVRDEIVGPAGPTTATRMDRFTDMMLGKLGLIGMIGKAERGAATIASIKRHRAVYLIAVGGAAYLVAKAIISSRVIAFADLGMEAIHEFEVKDMPVSVAVDADGNAVHQTGPRQWQEIIRRKKDASCL